MDIGRLELRRALTPQQVDRLTIFYDAEWWTRGRTRTEVETMLAAGMPLFAFVEPETYELVAFARTITDGVFKALILDVIVAPAWRGTGLGRHLMDVVLADPAIAAVRHRELYCVEAMVPFYEKWGFIDQPAGLRFMRLAR